MVVLGPAGQSVPDRRKGLSETVMEISEAELLSLRYRWEMQPGQSLSAVGSSLDFTSGVSTTKEFKSSQYQIWIVFRFFFFLTRRKGNGAESRVSSKMVEVLALYDLLIGQ